MSLLALEMPPLVPFIEGIDLGKRPLGVICLGNAFTLLVLASKRELMRRNEPLSIIVFGNASPSFLLESEQIEEK